MNDQMIRVISSPSSSTTGFCTLILAMVVSLRGVEGSPGAAEGDSPGRRCYRGGVPCHVMATMPRAATGEERAPWRTHEVFNQAPPLEGRNVFADNTPLVEATEREGASWALERASELGELIGGEPQQVWGRQANENKPVLHTHDRYGHRIDEVEFHPAWHQLMRMGVEHELHALPWREQREARSACGARGDVHDRDAGRGGVRVPDHDDVRGRAGAARPARAGGRVGAAGDRHHV